MAFFATAFEILFFVFSSILEIIEDVYLFVESHYDRDRDFEKIDDFLDFALRSGFKLFCSLVFVACLSLWTWYNLPLKQFSRHDLEEERDDALILIQQLEARISELETRNSELQTLSEKTLEDRDSYRRDFALQATENIVLQNKLDRLQYQLDIKADLESTLDRSQEYCLELETSLRLSRQLRQADDDERETRSAKSRKAKAKIEELRLSVDIQADKIDGYKATIAELQEKAKANEAFQKALELTRLENTRDQAKQGRQDQALRARIEELETLLEAAHKDLEANKLDNIRHQLAETTRIEAANEERTTLHNQQAKAEIEELRLSVGIQADKIDGYKATIAELQEKAKANEAFQRALELTRLENTRDQANQGRQDQALRARIEELETLLEAAHKDLEANKLDNVRHQLAETTRIEAANEERTTLHNQQAKNQDLLQAKDDELQRINAQHLEERESQRIQIKALQDALSEHDNAMDVDVASDHVCDHSRCVDEANLCEARISDLEASQMGCDIKLGRLQTEANDKGIKIAGLLAQLEDRKAAIESLQASVDTSNRSWSQLRAHLQLGGEHDFASLGRLIGQWQANSASQDHRCDHSACHSQFLEDSNEISELRNTVSSLTKKVDDRERRISNFTTESQNANRRAVNKIKGELQATEKALAAEKAGRQAAVETERRIARERFDSSNPLQEVVLGLRKQLAEMTINRDSCRAANETYRKQSFEALNKAKDTDAAQKQVENQRDELVKTVGRLEAKLSGMVEAEKKDKEMEVEAGSSGASKKRPNDGDEDERPAKILRDE